MPDETQGEQSRGQPIAQWTAIPTPARVANALLGALPKGKRLNRQNWARVWAIVCWGIALAMLMLIASPVDFTDRQTRLIYAVLIVAIILGQQMLTEAKVDNNRSAIDELNRQSSQIIEEVKHTRHQIGDRVNESVAKGVEAGMSLIERRPADCGETPESHAQVERIVAEVLRQNHNQQVDNGE